VAYEHEVDLTEGLAAVGAGVERFLDVAWLRKRPRFPVRTLDRPRHDVLEPAEDGVPLTGLLLEPEPVVGLDLVAAPRAAFTEISLEIGHG
jgi:hypothetical protein